METCKVELPGKGRPSKCAQLDTRLSKDGWEYHLTMTEVTSLACADEALITKTDRMQDVNRELESFSYSVAHDLRVSLRAIDGYACMLLKKHWHEFDEDSPRKFNEITANSQHLGQLINDILILSRLGKQKMSVIKLDIEVISLVEHQNKLGESTTSIFQSASMPSSGKSMHLTFLMFSSVGSAAEPPMEPR